MRERWFFEDFTVGQSLPTSEIVVDAGEAESFGRRFAPIAIDVGPWAQPSGHGAAVSEWLVTALGMRMICDAFLHHTASLGAPGVDEVEWLQPVFVGDRLRLESRLTTLRASRSKPEMGLVGFEFGIANQHGTRVMRQSNVILIERRTRETQP